MLTIRFQRTGKRNRPEFRMVVAPKTAAAQKKFTEILASYNPRTKELVIKDRARLDYWIGQKLSLSPSVHNLLVSKQIITDAKKVTAFSLPKKEVKAEEKPAAVAAPAETPAEAPAETAEPAAEQSAE
jgi:small subunit ribosomal protein S16